MNGVGLRPLSNAGDPSQNSSTWEKKISNMKTPLLILTSCLVCLAGTQAQSPSGGWVPHPDALEQPNIPHGKLEAMEPFESKIFTGTVRDWSIYIPAQLKPGEAAAVMVFQDGHDYANVKGRWRVPVVFDNLIARGEMPPTVAVFINPGHDVSAQKPQTPWKSSNRSLEYDSLGDRYARFLLEEILPEVSKKCQISGDPEMRAICGASSGGICAFTVAWERPEAFRKVLSTIGSFVNLRGGNAYPSLIRKTEPKPLRVYLADSSGDLDNAYGNWPLANKQMAAALSYMGYDVRFDFAEGFGHNSEHGSSIFPDALRWLWRSARHVAVVDTKGDLRGDLTLLNLLVAGRGWELVADGLGFADAPCADKDGNFYFSDMKAAAVYRVGLDGKRMKIADESVSGLKFGPSGLLYGCQGAKKRVISINLTDGAVVEVAAGVQPNDLAVSADGFIYITETGAKRVTRIDSKTGEVRSVDEGINGPNGIALSPDGSTLAVSDFKGEFVWAFRVEVDGTLSAKAPYMSLRLPIDPKGEFKFNEPPPYQSVSKGDGMAVDRVGRYYVTSALGVQVFDPTGRLCGVLSKPQIDAPLTSCTLAGEGHNTLFVTNGDKVFRRVLTVEKPR
jgi:sugar lactone lactonase YvrE/enterochelin esterase-like enzyme